MSDLSQRSLHGHTLSNTYFLHGPLIAASTFTNLAQFVRADQDWHQFAFRLSDHFAI